MYTSNRTDRDRTFDASQTKREVIFQTRDAYRQSVFDAAQTRRDRDFEQMRSQQRLLCGEVARRRQVLFVRGRENRQKAYDDVEVLYRLFDKLIDSVDTAFCAASKERDEKISNVVRRAIFRLQHPANATG